MSAQEESDAMMATTANGEPLEPGEPADEDVWFFHLSEDARVREAGLTRHLRRDLLEHYQREDAEKAARSRRLFGVVPVGFLRSDDPDFFILPPDHPPERQRAVLAERTGSRVEDLAKPEESPAEEPVVLVEPDEFEHPAALAVDPAEDTHPAQAPVTGAVASPAGVDQWSTSPFLAAEALDTELTARLSTASDIVLAYDGPDDWSTDWRYFELEFAAPDAAPAADDDDASNVVAFHRPAHRGPDAAPADVSPQGKSKWDELLEANRGQTSIVDAMREMWSGASGQSAASTRAHRVITGHLTPDDETTETPPEPDNVVPFATRTGDAAPLISGDIDVDEPEPPAPELELETAEVPSEQATDEEAPESVPVVPPALWDELFNDQATPPQPLPRSNEGMPPSLAVEPPAPVVDEDLSLEAIFTGQIHPSVTDTSLVRHTEAAVSDLPPVTAVWGDDESQTPDVGLAGDQLEPSDTIEQSAGGRDTRLDDSADGRSEN